MATTTRSRKTAATGTSTGALIGAAAAGVALGLVANLGRKFAVQSPTMLAGDWDEALKAEHQAALKIFDALARTTGANTTKRSMLMMQLKHALAKHALQEENVIYPAIRESGDKTDADKLNHDHGYVKQFLYELGSIPNDSPEWERKLTEFRMQIEEHMREEEEEVFPELKAKLGERKNKALTSLMNKEGLKLA